MKFRAFSLVFLISAAPITALAEQVEKEAPFGLRWGMSPQEVRGLGVEMVEASTSDVAPSYGALSLPKSISGIELYYLMFPEGYGLQKIIALGEEIENDLFGTKGKAEYERIKPIISARYGTPSAELAVAGRAVYEKENQFYQCLNYTGCGAWMTGWEAKGVKTMLQLKGSGRGKGYISIVVEGPKFVQAFDEKQEKILEEDKEAF